MNSWDSDPDDDHDLIRIVDKELEDPHKTSYYQNASTSLRKLLQYPFKGREMHGEVDPRYNDVQRVDVVKDKDSRTVRDPIKFMEVVKFIEELRGKIPSIGLHYKDGAVTNYVHFLIEENEEGWIYIDSKRSLQVRQIHKIEKILDHVGLRKIGIIANKIGLAARHEVSRINSERGRIMDLQYFDSIKNWSIHDYF